MVKRLALTLIIVFMCSGLASSQNLTKRQQVLLEGARSNLGYIYDAKYYVGGAPPKGRGACTEVLYYALLRIGVNLQDEVDKDIRDYPQYYPHVSRRDRNIDFRRCPNLVIWFKGYAKSLTEKVDGASLPQWQPGDVVFWTWSADKVSDHCGIISDKKDTRGVPLVIHNLGPRCTEDNVLCNWTITGHFRCK